MTKRVLTFFFILLYSSASLFSFLPKAKGVECSDIKSLFSSSYDISFVINQVGSAAVSQKVSLKNLTSDCFVSEYSLNINSTDISNVSGSDSLGKLNISLQKQASTSNLKIDLNEEVVGIGKNTNFTVLYTLNNFAKKQGQMWNLTIPKVLTTEKIESYSVKVVVPKALGEIFSVSPKVGTISADNLNTVISFGNEALYQQGINMTFGETQEIRFELKVPLESKNLFKQKFVVPIPSDSENQQVLIERIEPAPRKIFADGKGNLFAEYLLLGSNYKEIYISGVLKIYKPTARLSNPQVDIDQFTKESDFIQIQDRLIQEKAKNINSVTDVYNFVVNYLKLDQKAIASGRATRKGAIEALKKKDKATPLDFADVFVAIARAAGYPAREVFGIAFSDDYSAKPIFTAEPLNSKKIHVWVQIYDPNRKIWLDADPAWGYGSGTDYLTDVLADRIPLLYTESKAGLEELKKFTLSSESIKAGFSANQEDFSAEVDVDILSDQAVAGLPANLEVKINNKSGVAIYNGRVTLMPKNLKITKENEEGEFTLLPFQNKVLKFKILGNGLVGTRNGEVKVEFKGKSGLSEIEVSNNKEIKVASLFSIGMQQILLLFLIVLMIVGLLFPLFNRQKR